MEPKRIQIKTITKAEDHYLITCEDGSQSKVTFDRYKSFFGNKTLKEINAKFEELYQAEKAMINPRILKPKKK